MNAFFCRVEGTLNYASLVKVFLEKQIPISVMLISLLARCSMEK